MRILARIYDRQNTKYVNHFNRMITLTEGDANQWKKHISTSIEVIPNPLTEYPKSILWPQKTHYRMIAVGRLENVKGFNKLIEAFALIADKCPQWRIDIFGEGSCKESLLALIAQHKIGRRVAILPSTRNIYEEYRNSDFYMLSSQHEGFGMVILEAMSCGIPCISFDCDFGPREIIDDGVSGILVENGNIKKLAEAMLWMTNHKDERIQMGQKAREHVKKYLINTVMSKWVDLFNNI